MDLSEQGSNWYAAFVETGKEDDVKTRLEYRFHDNIEFYVPKRELKERKGGVWRKTIKTLFPGYILIKGHLNTEDYYKFKNIPNLWKLLLCGKEILPIPYDEIRIISRFIDDGEIIGISNVWEENGQVKVKDGPLKGMEGSIVKIDRRKNRAKVKISFLGQDRLIDLSINLLVNT